MSRRCGKGKGYRKGSLRRDQLDTLLHVKALVIASNLDQGLGSKAPKVLSIAPKSLGYKTVSNQGMDKLTRGSVSFTRLNLEQGRAKGLPDSLFYTETLEGKGVSEKQNMVRTGTNSRGPRFRPVGEPGSVPKDGGKGL